MLDNVLKINGKDYVIKFTIGSHIKMNKEGLNFESLQRLDIEMTRDLLYYGLEKFHKLNREQVTDLMDDFMDNGGTFEELFTVIVDAYSKSLGMKMGNKEGK